MSHPQEISSTDLRERLSEVLDDVEGGEAFVVVRWGSQVATLGPATARRLATRDGLSAEDVRRLKKERRATAAQALGAAAELWESDAAFDAFVAGIEERRHASQPAPRRKVT